MAKAEKYFKKGSQLRNFEKSEEKIEDLLDKAALEIGNKINLLYRCIYRQLPGSPCQGPFSTANKLLG